MLHVLSQSLIASSLEVRRPAVVLVPGAFHSSQVFYKVIHGLIHAGYKDIKAVDLPSLGHTVDRQEDINAVRSTLYEFIEEGQDVIMVGNSYGCTVIGEAVKAFPYHLRSDDHQEGHARGRILSLIYLSGYIPTIDEVRSKTKPGIHDLSPIFRFDNDAGKVYGDARLPSKTFYNALPPWEADFWSNELDSSSLAALNATATYIPYTGDFQVIYVLATHDNAVPAALSWAWINQPSARFIVEEIEADHIPMLSRPELVVNIVLKYSLDRAANAS